MIATNTFFTHRHCHQKILDGGQWGQKLLSRILNTAIDASETGCCGMAGSFRYEKEYALLSKQIVEQRLLPELNKSDSEPMVVSNGFSCRNKISDMALKNLSMLQKL
jgi:Fe-S oxidoreductase